MFTIALFELKNRLKSISTWIYFAIYGLLAGFWMAAAAGAVPGALISFGSEKVLINSPAALSFAITILGFVGVTAIAAVMGRSIQQDFEYRTSSFLFSVPISKRDYLLGRFIGSYLTLVVVFLGIVVGILIGADWPGVDVSRLGPYSVESFVRPYLFSVLPNLFWLGGVFLVVGAFSRQMAPVYITGTLVLVGYVLSLNLLANFENKTVAALLDSSGLTALGVLTQYWSVTEQNTRQIPLEGLFLWNRLLWTGVGVLTLALGYCCFRFDSARAVLVRRRRRKFEDASAAPTDSLAPVPTVQSNHSAIAYLRFLPALVGLHLRDIVRRPRFIVLVVAGVSFIIGKTYVLGSIYGTNTYPISYQILEIAGGLFGVIILTITAIYAGDLVWRERDAKINEIVDGTAAPTWLLFLAKLLTLFAIQVVLLIVVMACGIGIQLSQHFTRIELSHYLFDLFVVRLPAYWVLAALALTVHVLVNQKYLGHTLVILIYFVTLQLPNFGLENKLYLYDSAPALTYSDLNGYGHFLGGVTWFHIYWGAGAVLLLVLAGWFWVRGKDTDWKNRLRTARKEVTPISLSLAMAAIGLFAGAGTWIYYNTHVLNPYRSKPESERLQAEYEKRYKSLTGTPQPKVIAVQLNADVFPHELRARLHGVLTLQNKSSAPIRDLYVNLPTIAKINELKIDRAWRLADATPELYWHHYVLDEPLTPGATMPFNFDVEYAVFGFGNNGADDTVLDNGTFLNAGLDPNSSLIPSFGYNESVEIVSDLDRKRFGLPPKERMHDLDDQANQQINAITRDADWVDYTAIISTDSDQIGITTGYLEKEWTANGRRYFQYRMDSKMVDIFPIQSGKYNVRRDLWTNGTQSVAIEIDYQPGHEFDLDRMIDGAKDSLSYYTAHFGPYQHKILRIIEFPRYKAFAESFPNTVPFSESIGFIAKVDDQDPQDIDYPYFVTAHEVAHQWWAHQEDPANVQGAEFITESLAEYSALLVLKHKYGEAKMLRFLRYELNKYLLGRSTENKREQPLMREEGDAYVHYSKGSLAIYELQDAIGEDAVNQALAAFDRKWAFQGPPYATSRDLLAEFRKVTPADKQYLITDLFETITLFDNRATEASYHAIGDGKYDVELKVKAKKLRADGLGAETEIPLNDWIDIGVFDQDGNVLYLQKQQIQSGDSTIKVTVDKVPAKAGIDPLNKLIDLTAEDNVVEVAKK
jgi:ABC-2 type transport system permease protein